MIAPFAKHCRHTSMRAELWKIGHRIVGDDTDFGPQHLASFSRRGGLADHHRIARESELLGAQTISTTYPRSSTLTLSGSFVSRGTTRKMETIFQNI